MVGGSLRAPRHPMLSTLVAVTSLHPNSGLIIKTRSSSRDGV